MVKDKVGRPPDELGVSKSMECDSFTFSALRLLWVSKSMECDIFTFSALRLLWVSKSVECDIFPSML